MSDTISQDEINALFGAATEEKSEETTSEVKTESQLTDSDKDVLGEVGNISMGAAATTLSSLLNQKVNITTPIVKEKHAIESYFEKEKKYVAINIKYKAGLDGTFLLIVNEDDVKIISSIMMGNEPDTSIEVDDLHLSAMSEAMNQMVGTSCTSMSQVFNSVVDINPPDVKKVTPDNMKTLGGVDLENDDYVMVEFDLNVGELINSKMLQIIPIDVAKQLISKLVGGSSTSNEEVKEEKVSEQVVEEAPQNSQSIPQPTPEAQAVVQNVQMAQQVNIPNMQQTVSNVQSVEFADLVEKRVEETKEQISLIQDVPLEVVVELGRTNKSIKEILEFGPGVVIELNKMAGEPIDILINNKFIAKGEVVVIDENFGIRITEIIDVKKRI